MLRPRLLHSHMTTLAKTRSTKRQSGYALLLVMFFLALLVLATVKVTPNVVTQVKREKEQQMIWRGHQYAIGISRYYAKTHRFPTSLDDLYKPKTGIRFMRQAYKDPTNSVDGEWRLIYVGPNGQLIGSLKTQTQNLNLNPGAPPPGYAGALATLGSQGQSPFGAVGGQATQPSNNTSSFSNSSFNSSNNSSFSNSSGSSFAGNGQGTATSNSSSSSSSSTTDPSTYSGANSIVGGNIIGVGGKMKQKSIIRYDKATDYLHFEFIWDPSVDLLTGGRIGQILPNPGLNGNSPSGTTNTQPFSTGANSNQNPTQNPNPPITDPTQPTTTPPPQQ